MTRIIFYVGVFGIVLLSIWGSEQVSHAQDFYAGKTIRIVVGFPAGGGFDTYSRIMGRHIGKYIPGNPAVVEEFAEGSHRVHA